MDYSIKATLEPEEHIKFKIKLPGDVKVNIQFNLIGWEPDILTGPFLFLVNYDENNITNNEQTSIHFDCYSSYTDRHAIVIDQQYVTFHLCHQTNYDVNKNKIVLQIPTKHVVKDMINIVETICEVYDCTDNLILSKY
jgi:hypothetical protein